MLTTTVYNEITSSLGEKEQQGIIISVIFEYIVKSASSEVLYVSLDEINSYNETEKLI